MNLQTALSSIAQEVFRDQADKDYIAARAAYRMNLREQFLWAALQACEKYLKGILLFNELSARHPRSSVNGQRWEKKKSNEFRHDLDALFKAVKSIGDLNIQHPKWMPVFLNYLKEFGFNRYLTSSTYTVGDELRKLDEVVWTLRKYCQAFDDWDAGNVKVTRKEFIAMVNNPSHRRTPALYRPFGAIGGFLGKILKCRHTNAARENLVWKNLFFDTRQRSSATYRFHASSEIPPQSREWFTQKLRQDVTDYVQL